MIRIQSEETDQSNPNLNVTGLLGLIQALSGLNPASRCLCHKQRDQVRGQFNSYI